MVNHSVRLMRVVIGAVLVCAPSAIVPQNKTVLVPFIGCGSDGQIGPQKAPQGKSRAFPISADVAGRLAYYKAEEGIGVLAPRGWHCFGTYGSNGDSLYVSPNPIHGKDLLSSEWMGFTGPVVQLSSELGDTSGRFGVARMMARVFPGRREFVSKVIAEGIEPAAAFPFGPYSADKLTYQGKDLVEYETPPETEGLGTPIEIAERFRSDSWLGNTCRRCARLDVHGGTAPAGNGWSFANHRSTGGTGAYEDSWWEVKGGLQLHCRLP